MVARGKARAIRARPAVEPEPAEQTPQYVIDILSRMQAMEEHFADSSDSVLRRQPVVLPIPIVVPAADQESWLHLIQRFQKLRAPEFQGGSYPLAADKWKEDIDSALSFMGVDSVQMQRLAAYCLKGDAGKWYRSYFSAVEHLTMTWEDFI